MMLRNERGEWIEEEFQITFIKSFLRITIHGCGNSWWKTEFTFSSIRSEDVARMKESSNYSEIEEAIFAMNAWKGDSNAIEVVNFTDICLKPEFVNHFRSMF
ncbi:hypothetical protein QL285_007992 [Trifolium repens]|jgi:hypothetical protein|nr:hypothetical protein QL285_007992 [Trifolium repens]